MNKRSYSKTAEKYGFTLIEILGVLAIVSVLAGVLVPRVFGAITSARLNATVQSVDSLRGAAYDHFREEGILPSAGGVDGPHADEVLVSAGYLDSLFRVPAFATPAVDSVRVVTAASGLTFTAGDNFDISGNGTSNTGTGDLLMRIGLQGVPVALARELSNRIDGPTLSSTGNAADTTGRVVYDAPTDGTTTVYIYIAHY